MENIYLSEYLSKVADNADGYGKWANNIQDNRQGFDHLLYRMLNSSSFRRDF